MTEPALERAADNQPEPTASPPPDTQLTLFDVLHVLVAAQRVDRAVYSKFRQCSCALQGWVLTIAPQATLTLRPPDAGQPLEPWREQLAAVHRAMATRGELATRLTVVCGRDTQPEALSLIPEVLRGPPHVTDLAVQPESGYMPTSSVTVAEFLHQAAAVWPIQRLLVDSFTPTLPPPSSLPSLTHLAVAVTEARDHFTRMPEDTCKAMIGPYLPQATRFNTGSWIIPWSSLAALAARSDTLTEFTSARFLNDEQLRFFIEHCPSLSRLHVNGLNSMLGDYSSRQWGVREITLRDGVALSTLALLPTRQAGKVVVFIAQGDLGVDARGEEGLHPSVARRLQDWRFHPDTITLSPSGPLLTSNQTLALSNVLDQLRGLEAPGATVQLQRWSWHPSTLATLAAGLPALPHLSFALNLHKPLTDELLMAVVATNVHSLSVRSLSLQSDEHANTPWPWKQLTVETVDMAQLLKLPSPATACGGKAVIQFGGLGFEGVDQACAERLSTWLQHAQWAPLPSYKMVEVNIAVPSLQDPGDNSSRSKSVHAAEAKALAQLSVLQAVKFASTDALEKLAVHISVSMTHTVLEALRGLPHATGQLDMHSCTWPLEASQYTYLAMCVPVSYSSWRMQIDQNKELLDAVTQGIGQRRMGEDLPALELDLSGWDGAAGSGPGWYFHGALHDTWG